MSAVMHPRAYTMVASQHLLLSVLNDNEPLEKKQSSLKMTPVVISYLKKLYNI